MVPTGGSDMSAASILAMSTVGTTGAVRARLVHVAAGAVLRNCRGVSSWLLTGPEVAPYRSAQQKRLSMIWT